MLHAGLDLSRKKLDVCLLSDRGEHLDQLAVPPDVDSLRRLAKRISPRRHFSSGGLTALPDLRPRANHPISPDPPDEKAIET
jgi:hypothetical protein